MYIPEHFSIQEVVPPHVFRARGEKAWQLFDDRALMTLDELRDDYGPMIINTWDTERLWPEFGKRQWSGLRTFEFYNKKGMSLADAIANFERSYSQHKYGRAFDIIFLETTAEAVRQDILEFAGEPGSASAKHKHLSGMELGTSWFHMDTRNANGLFTFSA